MISLDIHKTLHAAKGDMKFQLDIQIQEGHLVTLFGESGAGKTSTLRMIAGLLKPDGGKISVHGDTWFDAEKRTNLKPQQRRIGYVFQDYALFPNMTVRGNLEFGLGKNQERCIIDELIEMVELGDLQHRKPDTLSGGQKQRVALARALVQRPDILLLDEPLSALDMKIRLKLQDYILAVHRKYGLTTILVSHDIAEIHKLSDWVFVLENGRVTKQGSPSQIFIQDNISGKFKFTGEILHIAKEDVVYVVTVLIHNEVVKVIAQESEVNDLRIGDKVIVASKAFNPMIYKVG